MSGCLWAWTVTCTSLMRWRRTAGETTAASLPSQEYERSFRRPPCPSLSRQVGVPSVLCLSCKRCFLSNQHDADFDLFFIARIISHMPIFIASKATQVSSCLVYVDLLSFMSWSWSWWCLSWCIHICCHVHHFFLSHPPPFQKKVTWVLKPVSFLCITSFCSFLFCCM